MRFSEFNRLYRSVPGKGVRILNMALCTSEAFKKDKLVTLGIDNIFEFKSENLVITKNNIHVEITNGAVNGLIFFFRQCIINVDKNPPKTIATEV